MSSWTWKHTPHAPMDTWQGHLGWLITQENSKQGLDCGNNPEGGNKIKKAYFYTFCATHPEITSPQQKKYQNERMDQWHGSIVFVDRQGRSWGKHTWEHGTWIMDHESCMDHHWRQTQEKQSKEKKLFLLFLVVLLHVEIK